MTKHAKPAAPAKTSDPTSRLEPFRERPEGTSLTTDTGVGIAHTDDSLKAGVRGPTLLEDFHFREKLMRFDHERIPERVVHARGSAAHGVFRVYQPLTELTRAQFLADPSVETPVFVRFSTVVGSRGSIDTARDVRGFATRFYTTEGNFDLVGNNIPVFFIQDGIKFPDVVHAVKPEPHHEMPQAAAAHDTFWDFVSLQPETAHMLMWVMSDRAIPRSYRMMEGFGVHTFRLVDARGKTRLCKFHWKPLLGVHSLVWDEAQKLGGKDADFHRRDLWEAIDGGDFPEWELGLQVVDEQDELAFGFDLLDPTKLLPEEIVPVRRVGKLTLNRNPDNFFAETEQVAYCVANVVPGIDVTNDPLMQARLFSYLDTQLTRLGGPNFNELPINRPQRKVHNHQQDGFGRQTIPTGKAMYHPNSVGGGCPFLAGEAGYVHAPVPVDGPKVRQRSDSFADHFSQARMFLDSQSAPERKHIVEAYQFELGKVERVEIRERMVGVLAEIDAGLAAEVAVAIGVAAPAKRPAKEEKRLPASPALSIAGTPKDSIKTRKVAVLVADGVRGPDVAWIKEALVAEGAKVEVIARALGVVQTAEGKPLAVDRSLATVASVLYDAVYLPGGARSVAALTGDGDILHFVEEAYKHAKPIGALGEAVTLIDACRLGIGARGGEQLRLVTELGLVTGPETDGKAFSAAFIDAIRQHRHFERDDKKTPA